MSSRKNCVNYSLNISLTCIPRLLPFSLKRLGINACQYYPGSLILLYEDIFRGNPCAFMMVMRGYESGFNGPVTEITERP